MFQLLSRKGRSTRIVYAAITIFLISLVLLSMPQPLLYWEKPVRSQAIILIVGPVMSARRRFAQDLLARGYGKYILIPAFHKVIGPDGKTHRWHPAQKAKKGLPDAPTLTMQDRWPYEYMEDTHRELLFGKEMMDSLGLRSANIVSSPYHMRRIAIIAHHVFGSHTYTLHFVPTTYGPQPSLLWWTDRNQVWWVLHEWGKIIWFLVYSPFCNP